MNARWARARRRRSIDESLRMGLEAAGLQWSPAVEFGSLETVVDSQCAVCSKTANVCNLLNRTKVFPCGCWVAWVRLPASTGLDRILVRNTFKRSREGVLSTMIVTVLGGTSERREAWRTAFRALQRSEVSRIVWDTIGCLGERNLADLVAAYSV